MDAYPRKKRYIRDAIMVDIISKLLTSRGCTHDHWKCWRFSRYGWHLFPWMAIAYRERISFCLWKRPATNEFRLPLRETLKSLTKVSKRIQGAALPRFGALSKSNPEGHQTLWIYYMNYQCFIRPHRLWSTSNTSISEPTSIYPNTTDVLLMNVPTRRISIPILSPMEVPTSPTTCWPWMEFWTAASSKSRPSYFCHWVEHQRIIR